MAQVARFEKVSLQEYLRANGCDEGTSENMINCLTKEWEDIQLPTRATNGSAGYDFYLPCDVHFEAGASAITIKTGIKCYINPGWVLMLVPRSGLGFKYGMRLRNTTGIVDADFTNSDTEGHIMAKVVFEEDIDLNQEEYEFMCYSSKIDKLLLFKTENNKEFRQRINNPNISNEELFKQRMTVISVFNSKFFIKEKTILSILPYITFVTEMKNGNLLLVSGPTFFIINFIT